MKKLFFGIIALLAGLFVTAQSITVTSPNGGEVWNTGNTDTITWNSSGVSNVKLEYTIDNGLSWTVIANSVVSNGAYAWVVSPQPTLQCKVRITDTGNNTITDKSDTSFIIGPIATVSAGYDATICFGDSVQLMATSNYYSEQSGGGPPPPPPAATYSWSPAAGISAANIYNPVAQPTVTTTYTVVADYNGVTAQSTVTVYVDHLIVNPVITPVSCAGGSDGSVCLNFSGGVFPVMYVWNNGANTSCITNVPAGNYAITVVDAQGCTASASAPIADPTPISVSPTVTNVSCSGAATGSVCVAVSGGSAPYTYAWSNLFTVACVSNASAGTYSVIVTDSHGCTASAGATINQPTPITISTLPTGISCFGGSDGAITTAVSGGTPPYTYQWSNGFILPDPIQLLAGNYTLTVTDASGCTATATTTINQPMALAINITATDVTCNGLSDGQLCATVTGGTPMYTYTWNMLQTVQCPAGLPIGTYEVTITDANNCTATAAGTVNEPAPINISAGLTNVNCFNFPDGNIDITVTGGTPNYTYTWTNASTTEDQHNLPAGIYGVTVSDANQCSDTATYTITEPPALSINGITVQGDGLVPDTLCATGVGGTPPYMYTWNPGIVNLSGGCVATTQTGVYDLTVTDSKGCSTTTNANVGCTGTCVWPGDADYDGLANNQDLLAIGLGYGTTGTARNQQDNQWYGHPALDWTDTLSSGSNYKHIDCDGNGTIDNDDTLAIVLNYGQSHPRSGVDEWRGGAPELRIQMVPDTLADGETIVAHLSLGDSLVAASNVYALAFTFNFDPLVVDSTEVSISFSNSSWLCNSAGDHLDIDKKFYATGRIETALTRIDHTTRTGSGEIGDVSMKITTGNINGKNLAYYSMHCFISDLVVIDNDGNHLIVNSGTDSVEVTYEPNGIANYRMESIGVYPNPAQNQLLVKTGDKGFKTLKIYDDIGHLIESRTVDNANMVLDISAYDEGIYMIKAEGPLNRGIARFMKVK